ncbi:MAG: 50S ribosomal protein L24 [archaeon]|jgi:large subunit ribosomal protein L24|nr:50S ribosomal protein L24 [archaeon]
MSVTSSKPKKQRKYFHDMPLHKRQKSIAGTLSKPLRKSIGKRALPLRKEDKAKVMRGQNKGFEGKISRIDYVNRQVFLEKLVRKKSDGTEKPLPLHASNLMIVDIDKSDARRTSKGKKAQKENKKPVAKAKKGKAEATTEKKTEAKPQEKEKKVEEKKEKPTAKKSEKKKVKKDGK